jgi:hypothetical protein
MGDLDRNGKLDLLTANLSGNSVTVLLNTTPDPTGVLPFGHGTWGCDGQLGLNANSTPNVGNAGFALKGSNAPRVSLGLLLVGDGLDFAGSDYFGINILLHVSFPLSSQILASNAYSGPAGEQFSPSPIPSNPNLVGLAFYCQTVWIEPPSRVCSPGVIGLESSRGLQLYIQP